MLRTRSWLECGSSPALTTSSTSAAATAPDGSVTTARSCRLALDVSCTSPSPNVTAAALIASSVEAGIQPPGTRNRSSAPSAAWCGRSTPGQRSAAVGSRAGRGAAGAWVTGPWCHALNAAPAHARPSTLPTACGTERGTTGMGLGARDLWGLYEPIHGVVYFTDECRAAANDAGYKGFWMGYFAMRAAPLGPVGSAVVTAAFYGFHPSRTERALPAAWDIAGPVEALAARLAGVDAALRRVWGPDAESDQVRDAADLAWQAAHACDTAGRVLGAGNQALTR